MSDYMSAELSKHSRRDFVRTSVGIGAAGIASLAAVDKLVADDKPQSVSGKRLIKPGDTILFQGDSITDAGRKRNVLKPNSQAGFGNRYAWLAAVDMLTDMPEADLKIYNRGISGNIVGQLDERWQKDCLDLKPNVVSILIGVNDFARAMEGKTKGTVESYSSEYHALIKRTKEALPDVKLVICEPFVLKTGEINDKWFPGYDTYRVAAKKIADEFGAAFVPFQTMFDLAAKIAPPANWAPDGVHPTADGAALMAHWWLKAVQG